MNLKKSACVCFCVLALGVAGCGGERSGDAAKDKPYLQLTDAAGRQVTLARKPERIVSLSPSYLGMVDAVGGKLVGRAASKVGSVPESMKDVPEIGMVYNINMENVVALQPDLALAGKNQHEKFVPLLTSNKINVIEFDAKTYDEVKRTVKILGDIYGAPERAQAENDALDQQIAAVTEKLPKEKKRVVIMHATAGSVTVAGPRSIAGCVADLLGFDNVAAAAVQGKGDKTPYSMESLVGQDPDIIFITSMGKPEEIENRLRADFKRNPAWNSLRAVRQGRVYALPENLFLINPGLRYPQAVRYMARQVYPEVFADDK